jgi:hypothetical protein
MATNSSRNLGIGTYSKNPTRKRKAYRARYDLTLDVQIVASPHPTSSEGMTHRGETLVNNKLDGIWPITYPTVQIDVPVKVVSKSPGFSRKGEQSKTGRTRANAHTSH